MAVYVFYVVFCFIFSFGCFAPVKRSAVKIISEMSLTEEPLACLMLRVELNVSVE